MKRMTWMAIGVLLLWATGGAFAQSLGEVARSVRKGKTHQTAANHQYDNDNIPKSDTLSVVGPAPAVSADAAVPAADAQPAQTPAPDPKLAAEERKRAADEWKEKIDTQKKQLETLNKDLELTQREYRLKAVAMYSDAGNRLRNSAQWDKEDADFKKQLEEKQKAVDAAKLQLDNLQEQARKAGVRQRE